MGKRKSSLNFCSFDSTNKDSHNSSPQSGSNSNLSPLCRLFSDKKLKCTDSQSSDNPHQKYLKTRVDNVDIDKTNESNMDLSLDIKFNDTNDHLNESVRVPEEKTIQDQHSMLDTIKNMSAETFETYLLSNYSIDFCNKDALKRNVTQPSFSRNTSTDYTVLFNSSISSKNLREENDISSSKQDITVTFLSTDSEENYAHSSRASTTNSHLKTSTKSVNTKNDTDEYTVVFNSSNSCTSLNENNDIELDGSSNQDVTITFLSTLNTPSGNSTDSTCSSTSNAYVETSTKSICAENNASEYTVVFNSSHNSKSLDEEENKSHISKQDITVTFLSTDYNTDETCSMFSKNTKPNDSNLETVNFDDSTRLPQIELGANHGNTYTTKLEMNNTNDVIVILDSSSSSIEVIESASDKSEVSLDLFTSVRKEYLNTNSNVSAFQTKPTCSMVMTETAKNSENTTIIISETYSTDFVNDLDASNINNKNITVEADQNAATDEYDLDKDNSTTSKRGTQYSNKSNKSLRIKDYPNENLLQTDSDNVSCQANPISDCAVTETSNNVQNFLPDFYLEPTEANENVNKTEDQNALSIGIPLEDVLVLDCPLEIQLLIQQNAVDELSNHNEPKNNSSFTNHNDDDLRITLVQNETIAYESMSLWQYDVTEDQNNGKNSENANRSCNSMEALSTGSNQNFNQGQKRIRAGINRICLNKSLKYKGPITSYETSIDSKKCATKKKILHIFFTVLKQMTNNQPVLLIVKNNKNNCVFEDNILQMKKGCHTKYKIIKPHTGRTFGLIMYLLGKIFAMITNETICTQRELFYLIKKFVSKQEYITSCLNIISRMLNVEPWYFPIISSSKGLVYGPLTVVTSNGDSINCSTFGGTTIPQNVITITEVITNAYFILVIEKDTVFKKMIVQDTPHKFTRPYIMITGKGFPDINTRLFIRVLRQKLKIPIFILVDADPYGIDIMLTYKYGSFNMSHLNNHLAEPGLQWLGVLPSEIISLKIEHLPLQTRDQKAIVQMLKRPYLNEKCKIKEELNILLQNNFKAEIEGIEKSDIDLIDFYLPNKLCNNDYF